LCFAHDDARSVTKPLMAKRHALKDDQWAMLEFSNFRRHEAARVAEKHLLPFTLSNARIRE
jgi:hypothetical protein